MRIWWQHSPRPYARGIPIIREAFAVQRRGDLLFGVLDLRYQADAEKHAVLAFKQGNDRSLAFRIMVAARVVHSDSLVMYGDSMARRKHTAGFDLAGDVSIGIDWYLARYTDLKKAMERWKQQHLSTTDTREIIFQVSTPEVILR